MTEERTIKCIDTQLDFTQDTIQHGSIVKFQGKTWRLEILSTDTNFIDMYTIAKVRLIEYEIKEID